MKLRDLLTVLREHDGARTLPESIGDGYLYAHNPFYRRIRDAVSAAGYRFTVDGPQVYFAFPLVSLETILTTRTLPYRNNLCGLQALERLRPGFFELRDLRLNRPAPNYLLHESAHGVAFTTLMGDVDAAEALRDPAHLVHIVVGEAFAMTVEYLAACCVSDRVHDWVFSINSYRHRVPGRKAIVELGEAFGPEPVIGCILMAFLYNNFFVDRLSSRRFDAILGLFEMAAPIGEDRAARRRLHTALRGLMLMDPDFRYDTSRLFLSTLGYGRDIRATLRDDPVERVTDDPVLRESIIELVGILSGAQAPRQPVAQAEPRLAAVV